MSVEAFMILRPGRNVNLSWLCQLWRLKVFCPTLKHFIWENYTKTNQHVPYMWENKYPLFSFINLVLFLAQTVQDKLHS